MISPSVMLTADLAAPLLIFGRSYWVYIWYGILLLGILGVLPAFYWGRQTHWRNLDEILRGLGTILVSVGMILLLQLINDLFGYALLVLALAAFIAAFVVGRKSEDENRKPEAENT